MDDIFSKVIAIILACIIMFILPIKLMYERHNNLAQTYILTESIALVDSVCNKGVIYEDVYFSYLDRISKTDKIYKVEFEHYCEENGYYTKQILLSLKENGYYQMSKGDMFKIKVLDNKRNVIAFYGGYIKDEDY